MITLEAASRGLSTRERLMVKLRASEINQCQFCINMHSKEARDKGIDVTPTNEREELIVAFTEMGTRLDETFEDAMIDRAVELLGEKTTGELIATIATINAWNRIGRLSRK